MADFNNITALPSGKMPTLEDAQNMLSRAKSINELIFMAGESLSDGCDAITTGCDVVDKLLKDIDVILAAHHQGRVNIEQSTG